MTGANYAGVATYASGLQYRASGGVKQMAYGNGKQLAVTYDSRLRLRQWNVSGVMGAEYSYDNFTEQTGRVTYARNLYDGTLDRWSDYDHVGRLVHAHTGNEARQMRGIPRTTDPDGPYSHAYSYDQWGNRVATQGWSGWGVPFVGAYTNNRVAPGGVLQYDAAGHLVNDSRGQMTYDATGQQVEATAAQTTHGYDGDRLRVKKVEQGQTTLYLRSSVLSGQVIAELNAGGVWSRGYVYLGGQLLAMQAGGVYWVHQDPVTKSQRLTDSSGTVTSSIELDPWGGETNRMVNSSQQPRKYTTYERDANGSDDAQHRQYHSWYGRFAQPDPFDGSYDLSDPQSFNRYAYVQNDPVNFVDPTGLETDEQHRDRIRRERAQAEADTYRSLLELFLHGLEIHGGGGGGRRTP